MNEQFRLVVESLQPKLDELLALAPVQLNSPRLVAPQAGVYLLSEGDKHLYVGRSDSMPNRLKNHRRGNHNQATFAFKLARIATGFTNPTYQQVGSRVDLMTNTAFLAAFVQAKQRVGEMLVRCVAEPDSLRQCLLEVYISVALGTPYNSWNTT